MRNANPNRCWPTQLNIFHQRTLGLTLGCLPYFACFTASFMDFGIQLGVVFFSLSWVFLKRPPGSSPEWCRSYITFCGNAASCLPGVKCFTLWILSRQPITRNTTKQGNSIYVWSEWQVKHEVMSVHGPATAGLHVTITFTSELWQHIDFQQVLLMTHVVVLLPVAIVYSRDTLEWFRWYSLTHLIPVALGT